MEKMKRKALLMLLILALTVGIFSLPAAAADGDSFTLDYDLAAQTVTVEGSGLTAGAFLSLQGFVNDADDYLDQLTVAEDGTVSCTYPSNGFANGDTIKVIIGGADLAEPVTLQVLVSVITGEVTRVQEDDEHLIYSTGWTERVQIGKFDKHIAKQASKKNETVSFTFEGDYFQLISYNSYSQAIIDVYVDGVKRHTIDLYVANANGNFKVPVAETYLPYGEHTVTAVISGKAAKSVGYNMYLDAVEISGAFVEGDAGALQDDEVLIGSSKATTFDVLLNDDVPEDAVIVEYTPLVNADGDEIGTLALNNGLFTFTPTAIDLRGASFTYTVGEQTATVNLVYADSIRYEETFASDDLIFGNASRDAKWNNYRLAAYSGGSAKRSSQAGDTVTIEFYGSAIEVIGYMSKSRGQFKVTLDGTVVEEEATTYHDSYDVYYQEPIYSIDELSNTQHTLVIEVLGKRAPRALGTAIDIDAVVVTK